MFLLYMYCTERGGLRILPLPIRTVIWEAMLKVGAFKYLCVGHLYQSGSVIFEADCSTVRSIMLDLGASVFSYSKCNACSCGGFHARNFGCNLGCKIEGGENLPELADKIRIEVYLELGKVCGGQCFMRYDIGSDVCTGAGRVLSVGGVSKCPGLTWLTHRRPGFS